MKSSPVVHRIPATSANLGPGYDTLGVALKVYNDVTVQAAPSVEMHPMAEEAASRFFETSGIEPFSFRWGIEGDVPRSRGLGSSVTVRLGVLHGLNVIAGKPCDDVEIFGLCAELEGHPDNAAPAQFGGFTVAAKDRAVFRFEVERDLKFVLCIPGYEVETHQARGVMPKSIPHKNAVLSAVNACGITAAFASREYHLLRGLFEDHLHQPYRAKLVPELTPVIEAAVEAGALGGFLSGSGSTIAAVTLGSSKKIAAAMLEAAGGSERAVVMIVNADNEGVKRIKKNA